MEKTLIADDDIFVIKTIKNTLNEDEICNFDFCESPEEAIELMAKNEYIRMISDWIFPQSKLNGLDILKIAEESGIKERILITSVSKIRNIEEEENLRIFRKPLSKNSVKKICLEDYEKI